MLGYVIASAARAAGQLVCWARTTRCRSATALVSQSRGLPVSGRQRPTGRPCDLSLNCLNAIKTPELGNRTIFPPPPCPNLAASWSKEPKQMRPSDSNAPGWWWGSVRPAAQCAASLASARRRRPRWWTPLQKRGLGRDGRERVGRGAGPASDARGVSGRGLTGGGARRRGGGPNPSMGRLLPPWRALQEPLERGCGAGVAWGAPTLALVAHHRLQGVALRICCHCGHRVGRAGHVGGVAAHLLRALAAQGLAHTDGLRARVLGRARGVGSHRGARHWRRFQRRGTAWAAALAAALAPPCRTLPRSMPLAGAALLFPAAFCHLQSYNEPSSAFTELGRGAGSRADERAAEAARKRRNRFDQRDKCTTVLMYSKTGAHAQQPRKKTRLLCMSSTPAGCPGSLPFSSVPR